MSYRNITTQRDEQIWTITICREDKYNAVDPETNHELDAAFDTFQNDSALRVAIVTGAGDKAFCAGGDIAAMQGASEPGDYPIPASGYGGLTRRRGCYKPIIAAVNGIAFGGGFEIALAADLIVASDQARFGLPEPKIGIAAVAGGMHRLVRQIGSKPAMEILLTAEPVTAQRAYELGLVNAVVEPARVLDTARAYACKIIECAPLAVEATKECALEGLGYARLADALDAQERGAFSRLEKLYQSDDVREGINAFVEKRRPVWKGR